MYCNKFEEFVTIAIMLNIELIISLLFISATFSAIANAILRNISKTNSLLIDLPDNVRKFHLDPTPLVGGIGIYIGVIATFFILNALTDLKAPGFEYSSFLIQYAVASFACLIVFLLDDLYGLSAKLRLTIQSLICLGLILATDIHIEYLPNILFTGQISLGLLSVPFTVFCCVGLMNAFNMIDGLNGLCAAIAVNALLLIYIDNQDSTGPVVMIGSILGFLLYNLGFFGKKRTIFLGDNGSNFLGLTVAITCVYYSDDICSNHIGGNTSGVTMLWLVAIPLWDCIRVILDRISTKRLPFSPGRDHFHHILLDQGLSANQILRAYIFVSFLIGVFGIVLERLYHDTPYVSFYCFVFFSFIYLILCTNIKKQT